MLATPATQCLFLHWIGGKTPGFYFGTDKGMDAIKQQVSRGPRSRIERQKRYTDVDLQEKGVVYVLQLLTIVHTMAAHGNMNYHNALLQVLQSDDPPQAELGALNELHKLLPTETIREAIAWMHKELQGL